MSVVYSLGDESLRAVGATVLAASITRLGDTWAPWYDAFTPTE